MMAASMQVYVGYSKEKKRYEVLMEKLDLDMRGAPTSHKYEGTFRTRREVDDFISLNMYTAAVTQLAE